MIVVADTTPINYLVLIGEIELLPILYSKILIPHEVLRELRHPRSPFGVRGWASELPHWCEVRTPVSMPDSELKELDAGERDAIQLALDTGIDLVLMDDGEGRREAVRRQLKVMGTVGILEKAAQRGLIDFLAALKRLEETNFRVSAKVRDAFLGRNT
jgi:predicted nucleic acid-binding protein